MADGNFPFDFSPLTFDFFPFPFDFPSTLKNLTPFFPLSLKKEEGRVRNGAYIIGG